MANFYLKYKSVSEVVKWYLSQETLSCLTSPLHDCVHHSALETNLVDLAGNISFELCRVGEEWGCLLRRARYSSLLLLLGAGGVVYLLRNGRRPSSPGVPRDPRYQPKSFWSWLFDEELVENFAGDSYFLHSHYFGPSPVLTEIPPSRNESCHEADLDSEDDVSLNTIFQDSSPKRFLKRPLFDIRQRGNTFQFLEKAPLPVHISNPCPKCVKGTCRLKKHQIYHSSSSSSAYSGSPQNRRTKIKTSTPETEEDFYLKRLESSLPGIYRPGCEERVDGDGSDEMDPSNLSDQLARLSATPVGFLKDQYRPSYRLYRTGRGAPDGKERKSSSPLLHSGSSSPGSEPMLFHPDKLFRDESMDSDHEGPSVSTCSMSGSMLDLVENAREIRRLIREVSIDSSASDLSLEFSLNENLGGSTAEDLDLLYRGVNKLMDHCENLEGDLSLIPQPKLVSSKSSMSGLSQFAEADHCAEAVGEEAGLRREGSIPDLRALRKTLKTNKGVWKLTNFSGALCDPDDRQGSRHASIVSDCGSMEWDSPVHGWQEVRPRHRTPVLVYSSSNVSESGDEVGSFTGSGLDPWEWDDCYYIQDGESLDPENIKRISGHRTWLPDVSTELDLETELRLRELSSCSDSNRSSLDRDIFGGLRRLPPSGRSSVDREAGLSLSSSTSSVSDDLTISSAKLHRYRDTQRSKSRSHPRDVSPQSSRTRKKSIGCELGLVYAEECMETSGTSSCDTGISSMESSICSSSHFSSSVNLSPVREAGEPPPSPRLTSPLSPEIVFGDITTTDTVIKINVIPVNCSGLTGRLDNATEMIGQRSWVAKALFQTVAAGEDVLNENVTE